MKRMCMVLAVATLVACSAGGGSGTGGTGGPVGPTTAGKIIEIQSPIAPQTGSSSTSGQ